MIIIDEVCCCCKHYRPIKGKYGDFPACIAYPDGMSLEQMPKSKDKEKICNNGIKFEPKEDKTL